MNKRGKAYLILIIGAIIALIGLINNVVSGYDLYELLLSPFFFLLCASLGYMVLFIPPKEEKIIKKKKGKKVTRTKPHVIQLIVGITPFVFLFSHAIYSAFVGTTFFGKTSYGLDAFLFDLLSYSLVFSAIVLVCLVLLISYIKDYIKYKMK